MQDRINELQFQSVKNEIKEFLEIIDRSFLKKFRAEFLGLYNRVLQLRENEDRLVSRYNETKKHVEQKLRVLRIRKKEKFVKEAKPVELESVNQSLSEELEKCIRENDVSVEKLKLEEESLRCMRKEYRSLHNEHENVIIRIKNLTSTNELKKREVHKKNKALKNLLLQCNNLRLVKEKSLVEIEREIMKGMKKKEELRELEKFLKTEKMNQAEIRQRSINIENRTKSTIEKLIQEREKKKRLQNILTKKKKKNQDRMNILEEKQRKLREIQKRLDLKHRELIKCENANIALEEQKRMMELEKMKILKKIDSKKRKTSSLSNEGDIISQTIIEWTKRNFQMSSILEKEKTEVSKIKSDLQFFNSLKEKTTMKISNLKYQQKTLNSQLIGTVNFGKRKEEILKLLDREISKTQYEIINSRLDAHTKRIKNYQISKEVRLYEQTYHDLIHKKSDSLITLKIQKSKKEFLELRLEQVRKDIEKLEFDCEKIEKQKSEISNIVVRKSEDLKKLKSSIQLLFSEIKQSKERSSLYDKDIISERRSVWKEKNNSKQISESIEMLENRIKEREDEYEKILEDSKVKKKLVFQSNSMIKNEKTDLKELINDRIVLNKRLTESSKKLLSVHYKLNEQNLKIKFGELEYSRVCREIQSIEIKIQKLEKKINEFQKKTGDRKELILKINNKKKEVSGKKILLTLIDEEKDKKMNLHVSRLFEEDQELLMMYRSLRKKLIEKTYQIVETNKKIKEKENLYKELRLIMKSTRFRQQQHHYSSIQNIKNKKKKKSMVEEEQEQEEEDDDDDDDDDFLTSDKLKIFESTLRKKVKENSELRKKLEDIRKEKEVQKQDSIFLRRRLSIMEKKLLKSEEERKKKNTRVEKSTSHDMNGFRVVELRSSTSSDPGNL